ncbi:mechanosensitive ion channel family protein [Segniliparus rugosus]|uniref:Mechanosensitive ion channel MscS domain-containing protein n=1 Tax=Segniliparus rugosus (strain ATCC BAA-974 / DSM 45345 / CCUG 50838 / CIP 108380 / JCM 13579 / CDC 945) TaxID=679197 RepID=E5XPE8_SEGRC|nr:mechanosensitive ion channel family protein [Segniliparus rugosus]EFV13776.1 hypothetical protein HMPREF9336_01376 [Segniliparus rugosus ATCC BAA-974]
MRTTTFAAPASPLAKDPRALLQWHHVDNILLVLALIALALLLRLVLHMLIDWAVRRNAASGRALHTAGLDLKDEGLLRARREKRAKAIGSGLKVVVTIVLVDWCLSESLSLFGVNLHNFAASAGLVGFALLFGAQSLVRDIISGAAIVIEDQFEVGDMVEIGGVVGTVLAIQLRITTLQDANGVVWHVRNGEISSVGNLSQSFSLVVVDLPIARTADLGYALEVAGNAANDLAAQARMSGFLIETPEVLGVETVDPFHVTLRLNIKAAPGESNRVRREFNRHLHKAMRDAGVPTPHSTPDMPRPSSEAAFTDFRAD